MFKDNINNLIQEVIDTLETKEYPIQFCETLLKSPQSLMSLNSGYHQFLFIILLAYHDFKTKNKPYSNNPLYMYIYTTITQQLNNYENNLRNK